MWAFGGSKLLDVRQNEAESQENMTKTLSEKTFEQIAYWQLETLGTEMSLSSICNTFLCRSLKIRQIESTVLCTCCDKCHFHRNCPECAVTVSEMHLLHCCRLHKRHKHTYKNTKHPHVEAKSGKLYRAQCIFGYIQFFS